MQRDVSEADENPAKVFKLAHVPFIGGLSGSVLEIFRLIDAYSGKVRPPLPMLSFFIRV